MLSDDSSPALIVVYLHVEACPLRCKTVLRHGGGWKLVWLDLMGLHPEGRALCHVHRHTTENIKLYFNCISKYYAAFSFFFFYTYSLALWRHVVCSWPGPLPPSASALSLAEVRKTVLMPKKLNSFGWIFSLFVSAQKWSRNSSLFCKFYMPNNPQGDLEGWSAAKKQPRCCDFPPRPSALWSNSDQCSSEFLLLKKMAESHLSSSLFIFWHTELCDTLTYCSLLLL